MGQDLRFPTLRRIKKIERYAGAAMLLQKAAYGLVSIGPVTDHYDDPLCGKRLADFAAVERGFLVDLTRHAPIGREVEKYRRPCGAQLCQALFVEALVEIGGSDSRGSLGY